MRKLTLLAATVVLAVPAAAHADQAKDSGKKHYQQTKMEQRTGTTTQRENDFFNNEANRTFDLREGSRLVLEEKVAYLVEQNGTRYFAPTSEYMAQDGHNVVIVDGLLHHIEKPGTYATDDDLMDREMTDREKNRY